MLVNYLLDLQTAGIFESTPHLYDDFIHCASAELAVVPMDTV